MFKPRNNNLSGLIQYEHITECVSWNFSDMADPMGYMQVQTLAHVQMQLTQAREEGRATGYAQAHAEFEARMGHEMQAFIQQQQHDNALQLHALLASAQAGWNLAQAGLAESVMRLVTDMTSQVVCQVMDTHYHETVQAVINQAVESLVNQEQAIVVRLCPADLSAMQAFLPTSLQERDVKWLPDVSLQASQCLVESAGQRVDASLNSRLALATELMLGSAPEQGISHA